MSKRPFVVFGVFAALCLLVIPWIALGKEGDQQAATVKVEPDDQEAKELFVNNCGPCHTLAAAGTDGVVGPDLDQLLVTGGINAPEQFEGIYSRVLSAVTCGRAGRMPKGILIGEEAEDVSAFVGAYAGQIDKGPTVDIATAERPEIEPCPPAVTGSSAGSGSDTSGG
jgi:mono/diheme cytochrome c family protein